MFGASADIWYTDRCDIARGSYDVADAGNPKYKRAGTRLVIAADIPCRLYHNPTNPLQRDETAAYVDVGNMLSCDINVDVKTGDKITVRRNAGISASNVSTYSYIAGNINKYIDPFGGTLSHTQIALTKEQRL